MIVSMIWYRRVTNVEYNFLLIDNDPKDENLKIRQNFNEVHESGGFLLEYYL